MFELLEVTARLDFSDRVFPIVLSDAQVYNAESTLDYVKYWEERIKSLDAKMKTVELTNLEGIQDKINLYRRIRSAIAQLVDVLGDMNVRSLGSDKGTLLEEIVGAIEAKLRQNRTGP